MIRRGLAALIAGLVLGSCEPAFATTWTVTNDATLSAANAGAVGGDIVRIAAGTYSIGIAPGSDPVDTFMQRAVQQSKANWRPEFTAPAVNNWIRTKFGVPNPTSNP